MKKRVAASIIVMAMLVSQFSFISGKELLKKDVGKSKMETAVSQKQIQAEQKLEEEKQALLTEERGYNSQYLVKHGTKRPDRIELAGHVQQSFIKAKAQKMKKLQAIEGKIKDDKEKQEFAAQLGINGTGSKSGEIGQAEIENSLAEGYDVIRLPEEVDPALFIEEIQKAAGDIVSIQPDYIMELAAEADTETVLLQKEPAAVYGNILDREADLQEAWKRSKGAGVTVALLDTGVDTSHPDLEGHVLEGYDFVNDRKGAYDAELGMEQAHGTHIAGIIAGAAPEAEILPLKVFENGRAYTSDILEAIAFAKEQGTAIVNMSFGSMDDNQALREAMEESGLFFVCAVGNNRRDLGETPIYPASFGLENSISVAALNQDLGLSYFSNYGEGADIAAWGRDVYSCFPGGEHGVLDGSSMAAGYVSAAAALAFKDFKEDGLKERLKSTSDRLSCLDGKVEQGNKVSFSGAVYGCVKDEVVTVTPEEEFNESYDAMSLNEQWELFASKNNVAIAAGEKHALVLKEDGTVWA